uniref:Serpentine receptor class gamma n=1 Tax=Caenorhabditis tropicalis TaxID=1561998 RepID=A0A1I7TAP2_9PELO
MAFFFPPDFKNYWSTELVPVVTYTPLSFLIKEEAPEVSIIIPIQNVASSINLFIQLVCIGLIVFRRSTSKGPFFIILLVFSLAVSIRVISYTIAILSASTVKTDMEHRTKIISLYVDYCSNLFSVTIIFFLSLNRCLSFVAKQWNNWIFDGCRVHIPIIFSGIISVLGAFGIIKTADVSREYFTQFGFIDFAQKDGFQKLSIVSLTVFHLGLSSVISFYIFISTNKKKLIRNRFLETWRAKSILPTHNHSYLISNSECHIRINCGLHKYKRIWNILVKSIETG